MRLVVLILTFVLGTTLGSGVAWAFDCAGVSLPSSIVLCSDPDLMRIADERQDAVNEARARLTDEQFRALMADQAAWVRAYATACGVPPERGPPKLPLSAPVKECFSRAGQARTAYIRSYGVAAGGASAAASTPGGTQDRVGPGFECSKAVHPLALLICADAELALVDLRFNQAYWALLHQLDQSARQELRQEDIAFIDAVQDECGVPRAGGLTTQVWQARECVRTAYERQRTQWLSRLSRPAYEEATRPAERHLDLQRDLGVLGFLPAAAGVDGVYSVQVRNAITAWQTAHNRTPTGFIGEGDARAIQQEASNAVDTTPASRPASPEGRDEIPLSRRKGIFVVPGLINETITLGFILDSGAADVQIPVDVVMTLARAGTISDSDFLGTQTYTMADGSTLKGDQFMLRELRLGTHAVRNVLASIGPPKGDLLLGQSFLSRFGVWAIDNARNLLILQSPNADQINLRGAQR